MHTEYNQSYLHWWTGPLDHDNLRIKGGLIPVKPPCIKFEQLNLE